MAEGAPEPALRNHESLAGAVNSAPAADAAATPSWNDQDWRQQWGWRDWTWGGCIAIDGPTGTLDTPTLP